MLRHWPVAASVMAELDQPIEPELLIRRRRYGRSPQGRQVCVWVSADTFQLLSQEARRLALTRSGAAHHLLRLALGLPSLLRLP